MRLGAVVGGGADQRFGEFGEQVAAEGLELGDERLKVGAGGESVALEAIDAALDGVALPVRPP